MFHRLRTVAIALALTAALGTGCFRGGGRMALAALEVATVVAEVALVAAILADHDDHYHYGYCHPVRIIEGRETHYYNGHWEYYDDGSGRWYVYRE